MPQSAPLAERRRETAAALVADHLFTLNVRRRDWIGDRELVSADAE
jgi:hypothetical protein